MAIFGAINEKRTDEQKFKTFCLNGPGICDEGAVNFEKLSLCYHYIRCMVLKKNCPDPCKRSPCMDKNHAVATSCTALKRPIWASDYTCLCRQNYLWDFYQEKCIKANVCEMNGGLTSPCIIKNTLECLLKVSSVECYCKKEFMGPRCEEPRDSCIETWHKDRPSGLEACGQHGTCHSILGFDVYYCACEPSYFDNPQNGFPDCYEKKDMCSKIICVNGNCELSVSGRSAKCNCSPGFSGADCKSSSPVWNPWNPWQICKPKCGTSRTRERTRSCSSKKGCVGPKEEFVKCAVDPCRRRRDVSATSYNQSQRQRRESFLHLNVNNLFKLLLPPKDAKLSHQRHHARNRPRAKWLDEDSRKGHSMLTKILPLEKHLTTGKIRKRRRRDVVADLWDALHEEHGDDGRERRDTFESIWDDLKDLNQTEVENPAKKSGVNSKNSKSSNSSRADKMVDSLLPGYFRKNLKYNMKNNNSNKEPIHVRMLIAGVILVVLGLAILACSLYRIKYSVWIGE